VAVSWLLAFVLTWLHLSANLGDQRIVVRWDPSLSDNDRAGLERTLALTDSEAGSQHTWNYRVRDRSDSNVRAIVQNPKVIETSHIDRTRFRLQLDRPDLPRWRVALAETDRVGWFALACGCIALVGTWVGRRRFIESVALISARSSGVVRRHAVAGVKVAVVWLPPLVAAFMMFQRRWISEDAFIDLRVVRNLLNGHGPIYNIGERVEAFTNPLWVGVLTGYGALGLPLEAGAVYIGLTCTIAALLLAQYSSWRLHSLGSSEPRTLTLPLGMLVLAALPPMWDFGTSGLETGLMFAWLAGTFTLCVRVCDTVVRDGSSRVTKAAFVAGLGPLIRPDLGIFSVAFAAFIAFTIVSVKEARAGRLIRAAAACLVVPLAYEVFRMGYYAALVPNTAFAKEAGLVFWSRGWGYFRDAVDTYALWLPLSVLPWVLIASARRWHSAGHADRTWLVLAVVSAAVVHATYVVAIGGDFMHVRMLLPAIFAFALPAATVVITPRQTVARRHPWLVESVLVTAVWASLCAVYLRPTKADEIGARGIADERSFYVAQLNRPHPVDVTQYRSIVPEQVLAYANGSQPQGRVLNIDGRVTALSERTPRDVHAVLTSWNIGAQGYVLDAGVHLVDRRGLADPIASRLRLDVRGRTGHEKELDDRWVQARFAQTPPPDARSAVQALTCGGLAQILAAIEEPLTFHRFLDNMRVAVAQRSLRIPADPDEARTALCGSGR
jgi:arabinofuranosyltransferase